MMWTAEEKTALVRMRDDEHLRFPAIAARLNRTYPSVTLKYYAIKNPRAPKRYRPPEGRAAEYSRLRRKIGASFARALL